MNDVTARLQGVVDKAATDRDLAGIVVRVDRPQDGFSWTGSHGNLDSHTHFFIASTTKLYTTALVLKLAERGALSLEDRLVDRVDPGLVEGIHKLKGRDYTGEITIRHLLSQTSGLPDYFEGKRSDGSRLVDDIKAGVDQSWELEDLLEIARGMGGRFAPGEGRKALYSDTNFQLLGRVIEEASGVTYAEALANDILTPLGLTSTYLYADPADDRPVNLRVGREERSVPKAMASFGPDGGIVSRVDHVMVFLRAFFEGGLFAAETIESLETFRRIFYPLEYGVGISRFRMPKILSPFGPPPELIGHSGLSGAFAFLSPRQGVYLAGTVNNIAKPGRSFRLMLRLIQALDG